VARPKHCVLALPAEIGTQNISDNNNSRSISWTAQVVFCRSVLDILAYTFQHLVFSSFNILELISTHIGR
jgi:hypothetical protein